MMLLFALESWDSESEVASISLRDRADTLLFLLQHSVDQLPQPLVKRLFKLALWYNPGFQDRDEDLRVYRACFITMVPFPDMLFDSHETRYLLPDSQLAHELESSEHPPNRNLGHRLHQVLTCVPEIMEEENKPWNPSLPDKTSNCTDLLNSHGEHIYKGSDLDSTDSTWIAEAPQHNDLSLQMQNMALHPSFYDPANLTLPIASNAPTYLSQVLRPYSVRMDPQNPATMSQLQPLPLSYCQTPTLNYYPPFVHSTLTPLGYIPRHGYTPTHRYIPTHGCIPTHQAGIGASSMTGAGHLHDLTDIPALPHYEQYIRPSPRGQGTYKARGGRWQ